MKLYFRADKKDVIAFAVICAFLLYIIAVLFLNFKSIINEGVAWGLNPIPAFFPSNIVSTLVFWLLSVVFLFGSTSSYFFSREKGFGYTSEKKEDGYSRWAKNNDIINSKSVEYVPYADKESKFGGVPLIYDKEGVYVDNGESHTMVVGATGSGKTQTIVNPTVKMLMKAKESMIISDPKGEIYEDNYALLKAHGYEVIVLNFREPQKGSCWNPYHLPYKFQKEGNFDKANELLNDLSTNIVVDGQGNDPFWQDSAASYLTGLSLALFEDADSEDEININSVNLMMTTGEDKYKYGPSNYLKEYFNAKDPSSPACVNALGTVNAPNDTKGGIVSVLKQKVKTLAVTKNLSEMLSKNDFELDTIGDKPTAVFMIIQDEKTTYHALATIFVKQCYESLISAAHKHGGSLPVRVNFLLDEFANMPKFKDITTMVTAARSRKIRFLFIIQNFAQIKDKYGDHEAETIRGNCGNLIYLLTGELAALEEISKLCGDKLVRVGKDKKEETRPLVTISELQRMKDDEVILIRHRCPPYKGKMKKDWESDLGFGKGVDWYGKDVVYPQREMQPIKTFDLKAFVEKQKGETQEQGSSPMMNPFQPMNPFLGGSNPMPPINNEMDIDKMIKEIDAKIAELEKEEEEEKKKQEALDSTDNLESNDTIEENKEEMVNNNFDIPIDVDDVVEKDTNQVQNEEPQVIRQSDEPRIDKIVHSNMVNFENFSMKNDNKEQPKSQPQEENKTETKGETNLEDYDDFFDDFFFDE